MTALDDLKQQVNEAALKAVDAALTEILGTKAWVRDKELPRILPNLERVIENTMREVYEFLPEHFTAHADIKTAVRYMHKASEPLT